MFVNLSTNVKYAFLIFTSTLCIYFVYKSCEKNDPHKNQFSHQNNGQNRQLIIYNRTGSTTLTNSIAYDLCHLNGFSVIHVNTSKNIYTMNAADQADFVYNISTWTERIPAFYHGHLAFINFPKYGFSNPLYINLIREPVERFLSYYYFLRFGDDFRVGLKRSKAGNNETFDQCFKRRGKDCDVEKLWLQIPYFCGNENYCREPGNRMALETAKRHLVENYIVVGYTDRLTDMITILEKLLPEFFRNATNHYNSLTAKKAHLRTTLKKIEPTSETLALLKSDPIVQMEIEFYNFAVREFDLLYDRLIDSNTREFLPKHVEMNVMTLNFLYNKPSESWFDYFINQNNFLELLQNEKTDQKLIEQLFDQFVEQALLPNSKKKRFEELEKRFEELDDPVFAKEKVDKLWLFAWACAARLGWDLDVLLKCSNVLRVYSMVSRLFEREFNVNGEDEIQAFLLRSQNAAFNSKSSFVSWIYAKLVLIIDMQARVPAPPQKPTVNNPNTLIDPALVEAERIRICIAEVRKNVKNAASHLERLVAFKLDKLEVPTFYCYQQSGNQDNTATTSTHQDYIEVSTNVFLVRAKIDLLLAHFAACHFGTAKRLINEIIPVFNQPSTVHENLRSLFTFDNRKFEGYKKALCNLNMQDTKRQKLEINPYEFNIKRKGAASNETSIFKTDAGLTKAIEVYSSANGTFRSMEFYPDLTPEQTLVYQNDGPPLWQMIGCFDYTVFAAHYDAFCKWNSSDANFADRIFKKSNASPILLKILEEAKTPGPILFYLKQLETLSEGWHITAWKSSFDKFYRALQHDSTWLKYAGALGFEYLRVFEKNLTNSIGCETSMRDFETMMKNTKIIIEQTVKSSFDQSNLSMLEMCKWTLKIVERTYFASLLDLGFLDEIIAFPTSVQNFSSKYLNFARIVATLLKVEQKYEIQWKYFSLLMNKRPEVTGLDITMPKEDFLEVMQTLKNPKICEYILSFFISAYNEVCNTGERQIYPYADGLRANNLNCYVEKQILNLNAVRVIDAIVKNPEGLDTDFMLDVIEILLRNNLLSNPKSPIILCQLADLFYDRENFKMAAYLYTMIINMFEKGVCDVSNANKIVNDLMISRLVHCFYKLDYFILAAVTGQLQQNVYSHLHYIPLILRQTPYTADAGKAYFPYIYSLPLFESMAEVFERSEINVYYISILKLCPNRASSYANSADVIREEEQRRRSQFINTMYNTMQKFEMLQSSDKKSLSNSYAELVEFLRNNLPDGAKKMVVENGQLMNFTDESGRLPIHWAAAGGCLPFVELCVSNNHDLLTKSDDAGFTPLIIAVSAGRLDAVRYLLSFTETDVNHKNNNGQTSIFYACSKNNLPIAKLLLENGAQVNVQDKYGNCPLHRAASQGHLEMVRLLLSQKGIRVDLADGEGNTALHMSTEDQNESVALMLVRAGADINRQNKEEKTPLDLARSSELRRKMTESAAH